MLSSSLLDLHGFVAITAISSVEVLWERAKPGLLQLYGKNAQLAPGWKHLIPAQASDTLATSSSKMGSRESAEQHWR